MKLVNALLSTVAVGISAIASAGPMIYHTKTIDNFSCANERISAVLLDNKLGHQHIAEPDLEGLFHDGECLGADPSIPFELLSQERIDVLGRHYVIAKVRFIPTSSGQTAFINYVPVSQIEPVPNAK